MRIFVAGAGGAVGRLMVPELVAAGHRVTGTARGEAGAERLAAAGATPVRMDALDAGAVRDAVAGAAPDVIVSQLTALSGGDPAANARIRRVGTRHLVDAARAAGVGRIVAQSISWAYEPGDEPAAESVPLDTGAGEPRAVTVGGVVALEEAAAELPEAVILRYGTLYGPGTWYSRGELMDHRLRAGELTAGTGVGSFLHVADSARAAVAALDWPSGAVNVVDDEPAPARDWAPVLAAALGAPAPPEGADRAGWERGADNTLLHGRGFTLRHPTWREGFGTL